MHCSLWQCPDGRGLNRGCDRLYEMLFNNHLITLFIFQAEMQNVLRFLPLRCANKLFTHSFFLTSCCICGFFLQDNTTRHFHTYWWGVWPFPVPSYVSCCQKLLGSLCQRPCHKCSRSAGEFSHWGRLRNWTQWRVCLLIDLLCPVSVQWTQRAPTHTHSNLAVFIWPFYSTNVIMC